MRSALTSGLTRRQVASDLVTEWDEQPSHRGSAIVAVNGGEEGEF